MSTFAPKTPLDAIIGVDPDKTATALCVLLRAGGARLAGGGTRADGAPLCGLFGALAVLDGLLAEGLTVGVAVETQAPGSQWTHAVEPLRRVRYMWEAAAELRGCTLRAVRPQTWQRHWVGPLTQQRGARGLAAYGPVSDARAALLGVKCANGDQRAALGIAGWLADAEGWALPWS